jgi:hypothetical protein
MVLLGEGEQPLHTLLPGDGGGWWRGPVPVAAGRNSATGRLQGLPPSRAPQVLSREMAVRPLTGGLGRPGSTLGAPAATAGPTRRTSAVTRCLPCRSCRQHDDLH